ncbi:MAG: hypothetical protein ABH823_03395 [bacterium]
MTAEGPGAINPNFGGQEGAMAAASGMVFTAADRKIIEERGGNDGDRVTKFLDAFKDKPLNATVENQETTVHAKKPIQDLVNRVDDHRAMLKHSTQYTPREKVEIKNKTPDDYKKEQQEADEKQKEKDQQQDQPNKKPAKQVSEKIEAIAKELKLDAAEIMDKLTLNEEELHALISHIKELHLKRLFTEHEAEFANLSGTIKSKTLASAKPDAKDWLQAQLNKLTMTAAEYKINLLQSLQSMDYNAERNKTIKWLKKAVIELR